MRNRTSSISIEDLCRPVIRQPIYTLNNLGNYAEVKEKSAVVFEDTKQPVSVISKRYGIVQNQDAIDSVFNALHKLGIEYNYSTNSPHNYFNGNRMRMFVTLPGFRIEDGTPMGILPAFWLQNSYDGSTTLNIVFGYIRVICTNGMITVEKKQMVLARKHTTNVDFSLSMLDYKLTGVLDSMHTMEDKIRKMKEIPAENSNELAFYQRILPPALGKKANIRINEEKPETIWDLYNIFTNIVSHSYANAASQPLMANQVAKLFSNHL